MPIKTTTKHSALRNRPLTLRSSPPIISWPWSITPTTTKATRPNSSRSTKPTVYYQTIAQGRTTRAPGITAVRATITSSNRAALTRINIAILEIRASALSTATTPTIHGAATINGRTRSGRKRNGRAETAIMKTHTKPIVDFGSSMSKRRGRGCREGLKYTIKWGETNKISRRRCRAIWKRQQET